ncbi:hypothetical protein CEXT_51501 [Caerostris extrusa]|uniref:Uncharacterized protein n=1 Tax=Caerostris extrusa TaxID=172846 RepID=A0AAV4N5F7_CAEEX|nr:hypothetical protein CEXT_51501 [Caerostris extrusa]
MLQEQSIIASFRPYTLEKNSPISHSKSQTLHPHTPQAPRLIRVRSSHLFSLIGRTRLSTTFCHLHLSSFDTFFPTSHAKESRKLSPIMYVRHQ